MAIYCPSCGRSIPDDSRVCAYCGKPIPAHGAQPVPQAEQKKDKTALIIVIVLAVVIIIPIAIAATVYVYVSGMIGSGPSLDYLQMAKENNTLVVTYVYPSDLQWSMISVSGHASLPSGSIDEGDIITDCSGTVRLSWKSSNRLIGSWIFT